MSPSSRVTPPAQAPRYDRRDDEPRAGLRTSRRWDQMSARDRVALSLLLHPDRGIPRAV